MSTTRPSSTIHSTTSNPALTALQSRILSKRAELTHLLSLRDLSATLASQMTALESQLTKLRDGTEAVAAVMGNWEGVLGVIGMVGQGLVDVCKEEEGGGEGVGVKVELEEEGKRLPGTLVRIPVGTGEVGGGAGGGVGPG